ncbi:MAG: hypothetical protein OEW64_08230 [Gammaproteobacteria bacterium]|nr:hypothetical protein [Gammaproteobacteria bacterium]
MRRLALLFLAGVLIGCSQPARTVLVHPAGQPPALLSEWGVVLASRQRLELNAGVIPYELNAPLFSDYALKLRTVWMPAGTSAQYDASREFEFPPGTIISKTFYYRKAPGWSADRPVVVMSNVAHELPADGFLSLDEYQLIETRLLVRYAEGWHAYPYVWNAAQDDATLEFAGDVRALELVGEASRQNINYVVPDANQCGGCHTPDHAAAELRPLGPKAWQLNRPYAWWGDAANQLGHWADAGLLAGAPQAWPAAIPATDEWRVKVYLDANCAHCHNPAGAADTSALHLNIEAPVDRHYGLCKTPVAVGRGSGDRPYDIYPGRPDDSILLYRMQHTDPAIAMPELGRSAIHTEGVALVRAWIAAMPGEC